MYLEKNNLIKLSFDNSETLGYKGIMDLMLTLMAVLAFTVVGLLLTLMILSARAKLVSTAPVQIRINEDEELTKEVKSGQTLLAALTSHGIAVPSPCGGKATCKQCRVIVKEGGGAPLETDKGSFTPRELLEGWRLSCQCKVREDLKIKIPENLIELKEFTGKVVSNQNVATFIKELIVEIDNPPEYQPGDYLQFAVPAYKTNTSDWKATMDEKYFSDWERFHLFDHTIEFEPTETTIRAYSMASYPAEGKRFIFNIRIATPPMVKGELKKGIPWGVCSTYTFSLKSGDEIKLSGPYGESHMICDARPLVFLIGGAGSSFGRSHILDLFYTQHTDRQVDLWYGARSLKENIYQDEYEKLAGEKTNFAYHLVLSEPDESDLQGGWPKDDPTKTGYLFKAFEVGQLSKMEEPESALYYVCGPPLHNQSVLKLLDNYGVPRENIVLDDFGS